MKTLKAIIWALFVSFGVMLAHFSLSEILPPGLKETTAVVILCSFGFFNALTKDFPVVATFAKFTIILIVMLMLLTLTNTGSMDGEFAFVLLSFVFAAAFYHLKARWQDTTERLRAQGIGPGGLPISE